MMSTTYEPISSCRLIAYESPSRILAKLTGGACSAGGIDRMAASAQSDTTNVATSSPNANGNPNVAIQIPANAGPPTAATVLWSDDSADTAASSSRSTSCGVNDSSAGL